MSVKKHYDEHLARFYSWMTGNLAERQAEFRDFMLRNGIQPVLSKAAIDLGCGHGIQAIPLAQAGFAVVAIDFCPKLLAELEDNAVGFPIRMMNDDIRNIINYCHIKPELIVCCGDTITQLEDRKEVQEFIGNCATALQRGGRILLSFRDYSNALPDHARSIPVKSDENRKLICILDYDDEHVTVTDQLHEKTVDGWQQTESTYRKVRVSDQDVVEYLENCGLTIMAVETIRGMVHVLALKEK